MLAPSPVLDYPVSYQHKHKWAILVEEKFSREFPYDSEQTVIAVCTIPECGVRLTKEQIEAVLDESEG